MRSVWSYPRNTGIRSVSSPFHLARVVIYCDLSICRRSCSIQHVTESNLRRALRGAPHFFPPAGRSARDPAFPSLEPRIVRNGVGTAAREHVEHTEHPEQAIKSVLARGVRAEAIGYGLAQQGIRQDAQIGDRAGQLVGHRDLSACRRLLPFNRIPKCRSASAG